MGYICTNALGRVAPGLRVCERPVRKRKWRKPAGGVRKAYLFHIDFLWGNRMSFASIRSRSGSGALLLTSWLQESYRLPAFSPYLAFDEQVSSYISFEFVALIEGGKTAFPLANWFFATRF